MGCGHSRFFLPPLLPDAHMTTVSTGPQVMLQNVSVPRIRMKIIVTHASVGA